MSNVFTMLSYVWRNSGHLNLLIFASNWHLGDLYTYYRVTDRLTGKHGQTDRLTGKHGQTD